MTWIQVILMLVAYAIVMRLVLAVLSICKKDDDAKQSTD